MSFSNTQMLPKAEYPIKYAPSKKQFLLIRIPEWIEAEGA
jgi:hypothetical protein